MKYRALPALAVLMVACAGDCSELAIYLGVGEVLGPGKIVQVDEEGRVLSSVDLPNTPYGVALDTDRVLAALPRAGEVVGVSRTVSFRQACNFWRGS